MPISELPHLKKIKAGIDSTIKQLEDFGGLRMQSEITLLNCEFSNFVNHFEKRHGIVQVFSFDDDDLKFHIAAWTKKRRVIGPVFDLYDTLPSLFP